MARQTGGFGPDADFPRQNGEGRTVAEDELEDEAWADALTKSSTNAKKQNPYGPQFPALDRYFKAR